MTYILSGLKYWKYEVFACLFVIILVSMKQHEHRVYERGKIEGAVQKEKEIVRLKEKLAEVEREYQRQTLIAEQRLAEASKEYQERKAKQEESDKVRYVEVQKIVEKPVYINNCIDSSGVQQLNAAINNN